MSIPGVFTVRGRFLAAVVGGLVAVQCAGPLGGHEFFDFADVRPIINKNCGGGGCHINQRTSGVEVTTYVKLMTSVGDQYGTPIVIPGSPDTSPLIDKISTNRPAHGARMPFGGPYLLRSEIDALRAWIRDGAIESHLPQRGDTNGDDVVAINDAIRILYFLFVGGAEPPACPPQADANANGTLEIADAIMVLNYLFLGGPRPSELTFDEYDACREASELSFQSIYDKVFARSCAFSTCHDAEDPKNELALDSFESAYESLVGVDPFNDEARGAGMKRVDPGRPENSFLLKKLIEPGEGEGNRMPGNTPVPLPESTIDAIRQWILAGAPRDGTIAGVPDISEEPPPAVDRMARPPVPENGVQIAMAPLLVGPRSERQAHYFVGAPFAHLEEEEVWVERIEIHMMEQSHHFILYGWKPAWDPPAGFREGSNTDVSLFQLIAVSQQSFFSLAFPEGVGLRFPGTQRFDFNSHYVNIDGTQRLHGDVYVNIFFAEPGSIHTEVKPIFDFGGSINVPPFRETTSCGVFPTWTETRAGDPALASQEGRVDRETHIYALTSHTHRHGTHFDVHVVEGATTATCASLPGATVLDKVFENWSWDDPIFTIYDPPLVLEPGQGLLYRATFRYDDAESASVPALRWGPTSEDEMIILLGYYAVP